MSFVFPQKKRQVLAAPAAQCSQRLHQRTLHAMSGRSRRVSTRASPKGGGNGAANSVRYRPLPPPRCAGCAAWPPHGRIICALFLQCHAGAHNAQRRASSHARRNVGAPRTWMATRFGGVHRGVRVHGQGQKQGRATPHAACPGSCMVFKGILKHLGCLSLGTHARRQDGYGYTGRYTKVWRWGLVPPASVALRHLRRGARA
jgi:hypothetical protein